MHTEKIVGQPERDNIRITPIGAFRHAIVTAMPCAVPHTVAVTVRA
jgi:hypothetical protein